MIVYAATQNAGKLRELRDIFARAGWEVRALRGASEVVEGDVSYADNAALKARAARASLVAGGDFTPVLGDDSGLEVRALGSRPGVLSARYGGADASWSKRRAMLLAELAAMKTTDRAARFVCALHYIAADGREVGVTGRYTGTIAEHERGDGGFSYDAIFVAARGRTFAEISETEKNGDSHRARAATLLIAAVRARAPGQPLSARSP